MTEERNQQTSSKTITGHGDHVTDLVILPDGTLTSCSYDHRIILWDTGTGAARKIIGCRFPSMSRIPGHEGWISSICVLPGEMLASGSFDKTIKIWKTPTGALVKTLTGHTDSVRALALLHDGTLVSGGNDFTIRMWNTTTGETVKTLQCRNFITSLAVLQDGTLASGLADNTITLWNTTTGEVCKTLSGHTDKVWALVVLQDGITLASGSFDKTIRLWNTTTGELVKTLIGHTDNVRSLVVLRNGTLASGSSDATIKLWNTTTGEVVQTLIGHGQSQCFPKAVGALVVLLDGSLASGSDDETIRLWSTEDSRSHIYALWARNVLSINSSNSSTSSSRNISRNSSRSSSPKHIDLNPDMCLPDLEVGGWCVGVLTRSKTRKIANNLQNITDCAICLEKLITERYKLSCDHIFHRECVRKLLQTNLCCPLCRTPIIQYIHIDQPKIKLM